MRADDIRRAVTEHPNGTTLSLRVTPRAPKTVWVGPYGDRLKLKVTAPPVEGAANEAVLEAVAASCGVDARDVELLAGDRGRDKVVLVHGIPPDVVVQRLTGT